MIKLIAFDLDGTLARVGKGILPEDIEQLRRLEEQGFIIAISSGKPTYYLCGFMRQVGLKKPILMGENGAAIQFGVELPPKQYYILPYHEDAINELTRMKEDILTLCGNNVWLQPNVVGLTVFPQIKEQFDIIREYLNKNEAARRNTLVYEHIDSFDITPKGINKAEGIRYLCRLLDITPEEVAAVGDGDNDVPMFEVAKHSVGIGTKEHIKTDIRFESISEAIKLLMKIND